MRDAQAPVPGGEAGLLTAEGGLDDDERDAGLADRRHEALEVLGASAEPARVVIGDHDAEIAGAGVPETLHRSDAPFCAE